LRNDQARGAAAAVVGALMLCGGGRAYSREGAGPFLTIGDDRSGNAVS